MTLTFADIERWDADSVRAVFHAATHRAQATSDAADGLSKLPALTSWGGVAAEAAKDAIGTTHRDLTAHAAESLVVAKAADNAANEIEQLKSDLATLKADAESMGMEIDPVTGQVLPGRSIRTPMEAFLKEEQLQPRVNAIITKANAIDVELANAIHLADGATSVPAEVMPGLKPVVAAPAAEPARGAAEAGGEKTPKFEMTGKDWATASSGAIAGAAADGTSGTAVKSMEKSPTSGPGKPDPGLLKWLDDPKFGGVELKGFSRVSRVVGVAGAVPAVLSDIQDGNSKSEAVVRESAGLIAGMWAGAQAGAALGSFAPGAGTLAGLAVGALAGGAVSLGVSKGIEQIWKPAANAVGNALHSVESVFGFG